MHRRNYTSKLRGRGIPRSEVEAYIRLVGTAQHAQHAHLPLFSRVTDQQSKTKPNQTAQDPAGDLGRLLPRCVPLLVQPLRLRGRRGDDGDAAHRVGWGWGWYDVGWVAAGPASRTNPAALDFTPLYLPTETR
jgi:hypothetical protein